MITVIISFDFYLSIVFLEKGENLNKFFSLLLVFSLILSSCSKTTPQILDENTDNKKCENIIATWVTYKEIETLIKDAVNEKSFSELVYDKLSVLRNYGINTIFLHVRAFDDALYTSATFPISEYCKNDKGNLNFDVLKVFINEAEKLNINIHAWINPYRVRNDGKTEKLTENNFFNYLYKNEPTALIISESFIYYNPASTQVQKHILDGIREILSNYSVSGIHFDDYFYPTSDEAIDKKYYNEVNMKISLSDFRRMCVDNLISSVYCLVKSYNHDLIFSVSPSADIEKNYNSNYADVKKWLNADGYADWIIPQIYFGFNHETMPFLDVLKNWRDISSSSTAKLIIGLSLYKSGNVDKYAGTGEREWIENSSVISEQIKALKSENTNSYAIYSSSFLYNLNTENLNLENEKKNLPVE